jgi:hypothetical protein
MRTGSAALDLPFEHPVDLSIRDLLERFEWEGTPTLQERVRVTQEGAGPIDVDMFVNEFWTARQRAAHSLHEISYRACFKPQLPRFFIERLTRPGDVVYDPFMGRGTTLIEAALMGRGAYGCDVNPLSRVLCEPRLDPPPMAEIIRALADIDFAAPVELPADLLVFYHPDTLRELCALRRHLLRKTSELSRAERWIRMVAVNRLTGHSAGFFSVYTLPPNQAVSTRSQARINARLRQVPPRRDVRAILLKKSRSLLRDYTTETRDRLAAARPQCHITIGAATHTPAFPDASVTLAVTSPPFLDVVDYKTDNWLRCWFCGIEPGQVPVTLAKRIEGWGEFVAGTLREVRRTLKPGGHVAFEVGEVRGGAVRLEEVVVPAGVSAGLEPVLVLVNAQRFTKTANCWGVSNNRKGTNTNRVVLFRRE